MQEGTDCKEKPLCKALYKYSYRFKEFLVWKDKMDTNGWKAQNTKGKTKIQHVATFFLHQKLPVVWWDLLRRRWGQWKGKMRDGSEMLRGEKRGWREAEKIRKVSFAVGRPCWRELCFGGGLEEEARLRGMWNSIRVWTLQSRARVLGILGWNWTGLWHQGLRWVTAGWFSCTKQKAVHNLARHLI